jgi:hypothetical protein
VRPAEPHRFDGDRHGIGSEQWVARGVRNELSRERRKSDMTSHLDFISGPESIEPTIDELIALLGPEFDGVWRSYELGAASRTPPRHSHRLAEVLFKTRQWAQALREGSSVEYPAELADLRTTLKLLREWSTTPEWERIKKPLADGHHFRHDLSVLGLASFLQQHGHKVELVLPSPGQRAPDLRVRSDQHGGVGIEVKAPTSLQGPRTPIAHRQAMAIIESSFKAASSGSRGQLRRGSPSMLVLAGFHLRPNDLQALLRSVDSSVERWTKYRPGVQAVGFTLLAIRTEPVPLYVDGKDGRQAIERYDSSVIARFVQNPNYSGSTFLEEGPRPLWVSYMPSRRRRRPPSPPDDSAE